MLNSRRRATAVYPSSEINAEIMSQSYVRYVRYHLWTDRFSRRGYSTKKRTPTTNNTFATKGMAKMNTHTAG